MEVKPGYKQTEVGIIPEEWDIIPLAEVVTEFRGGAPLKPSDFTTSGIKVLPKGGVGRTGWLQVKVDEFQYCSPRYAAAHRNNQVDQTYTIVVLRDLVPSGPSIGLIVQIKEAETYLLAQGVYGFKVNEQAEPRYLVQLSNTRWYRQLMNSIMVGSTQVHITNSAFKRARIPMPPPPEQRAIAEALSDVDGLLGGLDRLIAKKRDLKQAAMQQLLTGQTRLPGFHGEWEVKRLGDVLKVRHGKSQHGITVPDGDFPILASGGEIGRTNTALYDKPSVLIGRKGTIDSPQYAATPFWTVDTLFYTEISAGADAKFVFYKFTMIPWRSYNEASGVPSLNAKTIENIEAVFPATKAEQTAIATVLSEMDGELGKLEERREKTRALKQAMMQELLTGRTRLV